MKTSLYLMKRTWRGYEQCRVGVDKNFPSRSSSQRADCVWIIDRGSPYEMRFLEKFTSPKYGIPETLWIAVPGRGMDQESLDDIWMLHQHNWDRGRVLLDVAGLVEGNPSWKPPSARVPYKSSPYCNIDACKATKVCQSPNSCTGRLDPARGLFP